MKSGESGEKASIFRSRLGAVQGSRGTVPSESDHLFRGRRCNRPGGISAGRRPVLQRLVSDPIRPGGVNDAAPAAARFHGLAALRVGQLGTVPAGARARKW